MARRLGSLAVNQSPGPDYAFGEVLPEQTSDDEADTSDREDDADADLRRLLDDKPPHHLG